MAEDKKKYWIPSRTYEFNLKIGDLDMTNDLIKLTIITSIDMPYQTFVLDVFVDAHEFVLNEIYGQKPIMLTSILKATSEYPLEEIEYELMYLDSNMPLISQAQITSDLQIDRAQISITAVGRNPYISMNKTVNRLYQGVKIEDVLEDIVPDSGAIDFIYDKKGRNEEVIDQILLPPTTLYKQIKYLDRTFGVFNGAMALFCLHDDIVYLKNLNEKMKASHAFTIHQLATDADNTDVFGKCEDGKNFYTIRDIDTTYKGNSAFGVLAPRIIHVVKPRDKFAVNIINDLEDFSKKHGLISKSTKIFYDKEALSYRNRIAVHGEQTGYDENESFITARYAKKVSALTEMTVTVEQSMKLLNLMNVGEAVFLNSNTADTRDLTGAYILRASELTFMRQRDWESLAKLNLIRTNRSIS